MRQEISSQGSIRFGVRMLVILSLTACCLFAWNRTASLQIPDESDKTIDDAPAVAIHAAKRGNPYVNFLDGRDLVVAADAVPGGQPVALVSADFDSDGVADMVTADADGSLRLYKGIENASRTDREPFALTAKSFSSGVTPDYLFAGDFNADGKQDIVAAADNATLIVLLGGDGQGNFSEPLPVAINGNITAIEAGEIGRRDGQTDLAVAFRNNNGSFIAIYEHPESAFKHAPETIKLPSPTTAIAIGNLDEDFYADIAVASGSELTIIHGRGQAYPWDIDPKMGIKRPPPVVATRRMPFAISGMTIGRYGNKRGQSLALLGGDGNIYQLEPDRKEAPSNNTLPAGARKMSVSAPFIPTGAEPRNLATIAEAPMTPEFAEKNGIPMIDTSEVKSGSYAEILKKRQDESAEKYKNTDKKELEKLMAEGIHKSAEFKERAKRAYLRSISGKPSTLGKWSLETLISGSQLANASASKSSPKMLRVNVSSSNLDDILLVDSIGNQIQIVTQTKTENQRPTTEVLNLETEGNPLAVLPMRLNIDALSDLVVLRQGASVPSVIMTAPAQNFIVTSNNETGDCLGANPCSLRNAILLANQSPGMDFIGFSFGGVTIIAPDSQLPVITDPVIIYSAPGGNGLPQIEITGVNITTAADGLKIRTSNTTIGGLTVNEFTGVFDGNGSLIGGNGITIESTTIFTNNANNWVFGNYLGTDVTGSKSKSNDGSGLNIFDADNNQIGGTGPSEGNVISGNGSLQTGGVGISMTAGNENDFWGNIVGLNSLGTGKIPNSSGLFFTGSNNLFGGDGAGMANTVSGNGRSNSDPNICAGLGMNVQILVNLDTGELLTLNNNLKGNRVGTNPAGTVGLGNCSQGIKTSPLTQTIVGSITQNGRNIVSDNGYDAISCGEVLYGDNNPSEGGFCDISGNNIGTDVSGTTAIPNDQRNAVSGLMRLTAVVQIDNNLSLSNVGAPGGTTPGGACTGLCNLISGNMSGDPSSGALIREGYGIFGIFSNYIGTNQNGDQILSNFGGVGDFGRLSETYIGKGVPGVPLGNVFAGETSNGFATAITSGSLLFFNGDNPSSTSYIEANLIGTDKTGTFALQPGAGSGTIGISVLNQFGTTTFIGAAEPSARNIISGHKINNGGGGNGISIARSGGQTKIVNNLIGLNSSLNPLGNEGNGISVSGSGVVIGGTDQEINQIAWNGTTGNTFAGVLVSGNSYGSSIRNNSIHDNVGLGIDLTGGNNNQGDDVTANDCLDSDFGPNGLQNYPSLFAPTTNGNGTLNVTGYLRSSVAQDFQLDFYSNPTADPTGYGEGSVYIGSKDIHTNGNGFTTFTFISSGTASNITATATDSFGSTSEFSCVAGQCTDPVRTVEEAEELLATSICADPIVVTTTGDENDADLADETCDVDTNAPGLQCTLRAAFQEAEHQAGANAINFDIPGGGTQTIVPQTPLPELTQPVSVDASTQPGYTGIPLIVVNGINTTDSYGLRIKGGSSLVRGFSVVNFKEQIGISGSSGNGQNRIGGNYVGVFPTGDTGQTDRQLFGIALVGGAVNNKIGGVLPENRNIIGGNRTAISLANGSNNNRLNNNYIGVAADGSTPVSNYDGIVLLNSSLNNIGGYVDNSPNVISANQHDAVVLTGSSSNRISGNIIGVAADGVTPRGNDKGVRIIASSAYNIVGGTTRPERNVISGHNSNEFSAGVLIGPDAGIANIVAGNYLGLSVEPDHSIPNRVGIAVNADGQYIGNADENDFRNLIVSADTDGGWGIYLHSFFPNDELSNVTVQNNTIGTLSFNNAASGRIGVYLTGNVKNCNIKGNTVGHQSFAGIRLFDGPHNNQIVGNRVGVKTTNELIPNGNGIVIRQSDTNSIRDNLVSGNQLNGIVVGDEFGQPPPFAPSNSAAVGSFAIQNTISGNKVGTNSDATDVIPNGAVAIGLGANARNNTIGGEGSLANIVGGSTSEQYGIGIFVGVFDDAATMEAMPRDNKVLGNLVGISDRFGATSLPNRNGIYLRNARGTTIGGDTPGKRNIIGNSQINGIRMIGANTADSTIQNNFVGVTPTADNIGNLGDGIFIDSTGYFLLDGNTVGFNQGNGISISNISLPTAKQREMRPQLAGIGKAVGNSVGAITSSATVILTSNVLSGIRLTDVQGLQLGEPGAVANILSGNGLHGLYLSGSNSMLNVMVNSIFGTDTKGRAGIGNALAGLLIEDSSHDTIGGAGTGNIMSGNGTDGLEMVNANHESVYGNLFGVAHGEVPGELIPLGNQRNGITTRNSEEIDIGGNSADLQNIQAANQAVGTEIAEFSRLVRVRSNLVGRTIRDIPRPSRTSQVSTTVFGNGSHGILITSGSYQNAVGGPLPGDGNQISDNGGAGVRVDTTAGVGNLVDPNIIYGNSGLGIDIGSPGYTWNDADDADAGPNNLQNYPEVSNFAVNGNGDLIVSYIVDSNSGNSNYGNDGIYVEFFKSDPGNEGMRFLEFDHYTLADHGGSVANTKTTNLGNAAILGFSVGDRITATATDADGNTSEFFPAFPPTAAGVEISGRVLTADGRSVRNASVVLTDQRGISRRVLSSSFGYYRFDDVQAGETYIIGVSSKRYTFTPRTVNVVDELTGFDLVAEP